MGIGVSLIMIAAGAILAFAVHPPAVPTSTPSESS